MQSWKSLVTMGLLTASLLPARAQNVVLQTFRATVPYEFKIGNHKFKPGAYELVVLGPGLMVVRDAKGKVLARLVTRAVQGPQTVSPPRWVFETQKGHARLTSIWMQNNAWGLEILGEEVAMQQRPPVKLQEQLILSPRFVSPPMQP